jgi:hypothetical protein
MAPCELGGAHSQAGKVVACSGGAALRKLKPPKASPVVIQSTASEVMAILVRVFIVCSPWCVFDARIMTRSEDSACDLNHSELRPLPRHASGRRCSMQIVASRRLAAGDQSIRAR